MRTWLLNLWDAFRSSFWFVPSIFLFSSVISSIALIQLDALVQVESRYELAWLTTTPTSARSMMSTLSGALVTVTGVVFSMTMLTLAQTSSQFGSRLLRSILDHNVTQATLGAFLGTSAFCFIVLRNVREYSATENSAPFTPHIATAAALVAGGSCLIVFIYFVHSVSSSIQAQSIVETVAHELDDAINGLFPDPVDAEQHDQTEKRIQLETNSSSLKVGAQKSGYLQSVNEESLLALAQKENMTIQTHLYPGQFVFQEMPICSVISHDRERLDDRFLSEVNQCFNVGNRRTPRQDIECPIHELVEVAVRALSPGINDPYTALACLDYLGNGLHTLVQRKVPSPERYDGEGQLRLIIKSGSIVSAIDAAFSQIRQYGSNSPAVLIRMIESLTVIAQATTDSTLLATLSRHCDMILRTAQLQIAEVHDRDDIAHRAEIFRSARNSKPENNNPAAPDSQSILEQ